MSNLPQSTDKEKSSSSVKPALDVEDLNKRYSSHSFKERIQLLYEEFPLNDILFTSSFGTRSAFLIHIIQDINPDQTIKFIDTTYHFPETLAYKDELVERYDVTVEHIYPDPIQNKLTTEESWWIDHPNMCCTVNKIAPLDSVVGKYKIWISGLMQFQTSHRSRLRVWEENGDIVKFHPIIDLEEAEFLYHKGLYKLPPHPLEAHGYQSIGCKHCTRPGQKRAGRWTSKGKTECGLHTSFYYKK